MEPERTYRAHVMVMPFHGQGHLNPMLQFSKRLASKGVKITLATTLSTAKSMQIGNPSITVVSVYDDSNEVGYGGQGGVIGYFDRLKANIKQALPGIINSLKNSKYPVKCIVYDANFPWALDLAKLSGIFGAAYFTQSCAAIAAYYPLHLQISGVQSNLPPFPMPDLPKFGLPELVDLDNLAPFMKLLLEPFHNIDQADWVLFNSFDALEPKVIKWLKSLCHVRAIGPALSSEYLDQSIKDDDRDYGFSVFEPNMNETLLISWLNEKQPASVVYVSFGTTANLSEDKMEEIAAALKHMKKNFLWVVSEKEARKLPVNFAEETAEWGVVLNWCRQLEVLSHQAIGCFVTHCGWNSTIEALCLGVPIVAMPQILDQVANAYAVEKMWFAGVKPNANGNGVVEEEEIERCIEQVMHGDEGKNIKRNAMQWRELAKEAIKEGGTSDQNIHEFISRLLTTLN